MSDRLQSLMAQLDSAQARALGVLAGEQRLTATMLDRLDSNWDPREWLVDGLAQGLFLDAGTLYGLTYTRNISGERAVAMAPHCRPVVLRRLAEHDALGQVRDDAKTVVGRDSIAGFTTALYAGNLHTLRLEMAELLRRSARGEEEPLLRSRLWEAVCLPFDPLALAAVWGNEAALLMEQVIADASVTLEPIEDLYTWAVSNADFAVGPRMLRGLAEQALLRGDLTTLDALGSRLPAADALPLRVAAAFLHGDMVQAQRLLDDLAAAKPQSKRPIPCPVSVTAIIALLALSRNQPDKATLAKRLLQRHSTPDAPPIGGWPAVNSQLMLVRALRVLLRYLTQPEIERPRLSPHYLAAESPGWSILVTALTVLILDSDATTRAAWSQRLIDEARRWANGGYAWITRQAQYLATALNAAPDREGGVVAPVKPGEPALSLLLEREPPWRIALRHVDKLLLSAERDDATLSRRVAWYLDLSNGDLARPALEEYRAGSGWTQARRVDLDALRSIRDKLPPEDVAVLTAMDAAPKRGRFPPEAVEALCGHPRVFNGARGRQPVEVVRASCHIKTERERGHLVIQLEPVGADEGVHVVVESESRVAVYRINATVAKLGQALAGGIRIPEQHQNDGRTLLARLAEHVEIHSPELGACRVATADSTPCIRISPEAGAWWVEFGVRPFGEFGRFFPPGLGRSVVTVHADDELFDTERQLDAEIAHYHALLAKCPTLLSATQRDASIADSENEVPTSFSLSEEELYSLLVELRESGQSHELEWKNSRAICARGAVTRATLHGAVRRIKGWYLVNGSIHLDQISSIELSDLVRMPYTKSGRFIRLPTGDFLEVERRMRQVLNGLAAAGQLPPRGSAGELKIPEAAFEPLRVVMDSSDNIVVDRSASEWQARIQSVLECYPTVPPELRATLRSYQLEGYQWLQRNSQLGFGVCLADDMGLGKTLQVIALLLTRATTGPALVVAPTSVCSNWLDELQRFAPTLRVAEYAGRERPKLLERVQHRVGETALDVLVTSYALLQQDAARLSSIEWNTAVLDEAQFIKNPNSLRAKAAFCLRARQRVAMTGTPIENHLGDLWSVFHYLQPSLLGSFRHFQLAYLRPIERDHSTEQETWLKQLVKPFLLRRRKDEVLKELPPTTTLRHEVRLSDDEALRYALLRRQIHDKLRTAHGKRQHKLQVLAEITRLRRFCCHPRLVFPDAPTESSKLQTFLDLAEELRDNGHRALVFSQFVDFLELIREQLDERRFRYVYLDGSTPKEARKARVLAFQSGQSELFLISLKAGGFGLNLTAADYVIHLDPWWNPAVEAQATDRAHRIGQERPVTVYRLVTKDSIEERIIELHREKRALADALLEGSEGARAVRVDELMRLLGEPDNSDI